MNINQKKGFTIIELIVVISIISLISSVVLSALSVAKRKGQDAGKIRVLHETRSALQLFFSEKGYFPPKASWSTDLTSGNYIKSINTAIIYEPIPGGCTGTNCGSYHMGVILQGTATDNKVLNSDKDSTNIFFGNSTDCVTALSSPEKCYDVEY